MAAVNHRREPELGQTCPFGGPICQSYWIETPSGADQRYRETDFCGGSDTVESSREPSGFQTVGWKQYQENQADRLWPTHMMVNF